MCLKYLKIMFFPINYGRFPVLFRVEPVLAKIRFQQVATHFDPLVMTNSSPWKDPPFLIGKPSINGPSIPWLC